MTGEIDDTVTLLANGQAMTGWEAVRISRALDRVPASFDLILSDRDPTTATAVQIQPGMSCEIKIGTDTVLKGWIDRVAFSISHGNHRVRVMGRSLSEDLVDCMITPDILVGNQITITTLLDLATRLAAPLKIPVHATPQANTAITLPNGSPMKINAILTEKPWEIIERVARYLGLLVYDLPDGSVQIANVGASTHRTGFQQGKNVEAAEVSYGMDQRFSIYRPVLMSTNAPEATDIGGRSFAPAYDNDVKRLRPFIVVSEQFVFNQPMAEKRAQWEAARRAGRSQAVQLTCDRWRDQDNVLWTPNALTPVELPAIKLDKPNPAWVIAAVDFMKDGERGTVADILMMPQTAFQPEPTVLINYPWDPSDHPATNRQFHGEGDYPQP